MLAIRYFLPMLKVNVCASLFACCFIILLILFFAENASAQTLNIQKHNCHLSKGDTETINRIAHYEAAFYDAVFDTPKNDSLNININIFGRKEDFKNTPDGTGALHAFSDGYYYEKTGDVFVLKTDHVNDALLHEISHAFLHNNMRKSPKWFDEGLATYFGSLIVEDNKIFYTPVYGRIERIKELIKKRELYLQEFLQNNSRNWGDDQNLISDEYTIAYSVIYFLVKTNLNLVKQMANGLKSGQTTATILTEIFGSPALFESRYTSFYKQQN